MADPFDAFRASVDTAIATLETALAPPVVPPTNPPPVDPPVPTAPVVTLSLVGGVDPAGHGQIAATWATTGGDPAGWHVEHLDADLGGNPWSLDLPGDVHGQTFTYLPFTPQRIQVTGTDGRTATGTATPTADIQVDVGNTGGTMADWRPDIFTDGFISILDPTKIIRAPLHSAPLGVLANGRRQMTTGHVLTSPGRRLVRMHFIDHEANEAGDRIFDVKFNGNTLVAGLDIFAKTGAKYTEWVEDVVFQDPGGQLDVTFVPHVGAAGILCDIEFLDGTGLPLTVPVTGGGGTGGTGGGGGGGGGGTVTYPNDAFFYELFPNITLSGTPVLTGTEQTINHYWLSAAPFGGVVPAGVTLQGPYTFTGSDGASIPSPFTATVDTDSGTASTAAIGSNAAKLHVTGAGVGHDRYSRLSFANTAADFRYTDTFKVSDLGLYSASVLMRHSGTYEPSGGNTSAYIFEARPHTSEIGFGMRVAPGGVSSYSELVFVPFTYQAGVTYNRVCEVQGPNLRYWIGTGTWDGSWSVTYLDTGNNILGGGATTEVWHGDHGLGTVTSHDLWVDNIQIAQPGASSAPSTLFTGVFTGSNGASLPSPWVTTTQASGSSVTLNGAGAAKLEVQAGGYGAWARMTEPTVRTDFIVNASFTTPSVLKEGAFGIMGRSDGTEFNTYWFNIQTLLGSLGVTRQTSALGFLEPDIGHASFTFAPSTTYNLRVECQGQNLRMWVGTGAWPGTFQIAVTNGDITSGKVGVNLNSGAAATTVDVTLNSFAISDFGGSAAPSGNALADNLTIRWTGNFNFTAATYTFRAVVDDGVRIYDNGTLFMDHWVEEGDTTYTVDRVMTAGYHEIRVEYLELAGFADIEVSWSLSGAGGGGSIPQGSVGTFRPAYIDGGVSRSYAATASQQIGHDVPVMGAYIDMVDTGTAVGSALSLLDTSDIGGWLAEDSTRLFDLRMHPLNSAAGNCGNWGDPNVPGYFAATATAIVQSAGRHGFNPNQVLFNFAEEANGNYGYCYQPLAQGGPSQFAGFIDMYQRCHTAVQAVHPFTWVQCYNVPFIGDPYPFNIYPGDAYVDILTFDTYDDFKYTGSVQGDFAAHKADWDQFVAFANAHGKPWAIGENGLCRAAQGNNGHDDDDYYATEIRNYCLANGALYLTEFHLNVAETGAVLEDFPRSLAAVRTFWANHP